MITNTNIEILSVSEVNRYLALTDKIVPYIGTASTCPLWDGELLIYNDDNNSNHTFDRIIKVQVKGHIYKSTNKLPSKITYSILVSDLNHYRKNGGIGFFVVYFKEETKESRIYYSLLTPEKLKEYIRNSSGKNKTRVSFTSIPDDNKRFYFYCINFLNNRDWQASFQTEDLSPLSIDSNKLMFQLTGPNRYRMDLIEYYDGEEVPLYSILKHGDKEIILPTGKEAVVTNVWQKKTVSINGVKWYDEVRVFPLQDYTVYGVGYFLLLFVDKDDSSTLIDTKLFYAVPRLSDIINASEFVLTLIREKRLQIDGIEYLLNLSDSADDYLNILNEAKILRNILDKNGISKDVMLKDIEVIRNEIGEPTLLVCIKENVYQINIPGISWVSLIQAK